MERRAFLVLGVAALGLAGCTAGPEPAPTGPATGPPAGDPDDAIRDGVAEAESALIVGYRSAIAAHPELADQLAPFLTHHEAHLARVAPAHVAPSTSGLPPSPSAGDESPGSSAAAALAALVDAESAARRARIGDCDAARDPALARALALIAASEAQHAAFLDQLAEAAA